MISKICKFKLFIFPGKFPGKRDLDGKFPVSREAKNSGKLQTLVIFGLKFACRRIADRHATARISDGSWTFLKIPSLGGPREQCPVGKPIFRHFGSLGAFLLAENRGKFHFFHVSRHFRAPPRTPILLKIRFFWLKTMSFQYGVTTNFNGADWPTVE